MLTGQSNLEGKKKKKKNKAEGIMLQYGGSSKNQK